MKAKKEERAYINRARRKHGKPNGVVGAWAFDYGPRGPHTDKTVRRLPERIAEAEARDVS